LHDRVLTSSKRGHQATARDEQCLQFHTDGCFPALEGPVRLTD
jgi:hypothetical protein